MLRREKSTVPLVACVLLGACDLIGDKKDGDSADTTDPATTGTTPDDATDIDRSDDAFVADDSGWTCNPAFYGTSDGCDCGCGIPDPDCNGISTVSACKYCMNAGSCACPDSATCTPEENACPGVIHAANNWLCQNGSCGDGAVDPPEACDPPNGTTCSASCDAIVAVCGNGNVDGLSEQCDPPDGTTCDDSCQLIVAVCGDGIVDELSEQCDPPDEVSCTSACLTVPPDWTCSIEMYGAGDGCDCGCGALDPDCDFDMTVTACTSCNNEGSCDYRVACVLDPFIPGCESNGCPGNIDPDDNSLCSGSDSQPAICPDGFVGAACEIQVALLAPEAQDILKGKQRITRVTDGNLSNACFLLVPMNPQLHNPQLHSAVIDPDEYDNAWTYGYRLVVPQETCVAVPLPKYVILSRPLTALQRDDGASDDMVKLYVDDLRKADGTLNQCPSLPTDANASCCISAHDQNVTGGWSYATAHLNIPLAQTIVSAVANPNTPACDLSTALLSRAYYGGSEPGNVEIVMAEGNYTESQGPLYLKKNTVLRNQNNENVSITSLLEIQKGVKSRPVDLNKTDANPIDSTTGWVSAPSDVNPNGDIWVFAWDSHVDASGSVGTGLEVVVDGAVVPATSHIDATTLPADSADTVFTNTSGLAMYYANVLHPLTQKDEDFVNGKTAYDCDTKGYDGSATGPADPRLATGGCVDNNIAPCTEANCTTDYGAIPLKVPMQRALDLYCRPALGGPGAPNNYVDKCIVLRLPGATTLASLTQHKIESRHHDTGLHTYQYDSQPSYTWVYGALVHGIKFVNFPFNITGNSRANIATVAGCDGNLTGCTNGAPYAFRMDGVEVANSLLTMSYYGSMEVENSYFDQSYLDPTTFATGLLVRNNFFERAYGKPIAVNHEVGADLNSSPAELDFVDFTFNTFYLSGAINAYRSRGMRVRYNYFQNSGIQEGIVDCSDDCTYVQVHHNWAANAQGQGIQSTPQLDLNTSRIEHLEISDNQMFDSPLGEGFSAEMNGTCEVLGCPAGTFYGIAVTNFSGAFPAEGMDPYGEVRITNNLIARSKDNGLFGRAGAGVWIEHNTIHTTVNRGMNLLISADANHSIHLNQNVVVGSGTHGLTADGTAFPTLASYSGNYVDDCAATGTYVCQQDGFATAPEFYFPELGDYHITNATKSCPSDTNYSHAGFNYLDDRCTPLAAVSPAHEDPSVMLKGYGIDIVFDLWELYMAPAE